MTVTKPQRDGLLRFLEGVDDVILKRGLDLFEAGAVSGLTQTDPDTAQLSVQGTTAYRVSLHQDRWGEVDDTSCTCPYTYGPVCKHRVAAAHFLLARSGMDTGLPGDLRQLLESQPSEKLVEILLRMVKTQPELAAQIRFLLKEPPDVRPRSLSLRLSEIHQTYTGGSRGGMTWEDRPGFLEDVRELIREVASGADLLVTVSGLLQLLTGLQAILGHKCETLDDFRELAGDLVEALRAVCLKGAIPHPALRDECFTLLLDWCSREEPAEEPGMGAVLKDLLAICDRLVRTGGQRARLADTAGRLTRDTD